MTRHRMITTAAALLTLSLMGIGAAQPSGAATTSGKAAASSAMRAPHHPAPSHFTRGHVDNRWFPLKPGTKYVYRGHEDGQHSRDVVIVTYRTRMIDGVVCRVVSDRLFLHGILRERTSDFYAQTRRGRVWYFGENTAELNRRGHVVSREGSFQSGRKGAEAGIFMPASPRVGETFLQENFPGHAVDRFRIHSLHARVRTPLMSSSQAMLTREWTRLEPGVVDHKFYVRDIGNVAEQTVKGGNDFQRLVRLVHLPRR